MSCCRVNGINTLDTHNVYVGLNILLRYKCCYNIVLNCAIDGYLKLLLSELDEPLLTNDDIAMFSNIILIIVQRT